MTEEAKQSHNRGRDYVLSGFQSVLDSSIVRYTVSPAFNAVHMEWVAGVPVTQ